MSKDEALRDLIERVERAHEGSRELDLAIDLFARPDEWAKVAHDNPETVNAYWLDDKELPRYTASIDAAMTLVPEGWTVSTTRYPDGRGSVEAWHPTRVHMIETNGAAPAISIVAASLRAHMGTGG